LARCFTTLGPHKQVSSPGLLVPAGKNTSKRTRDTSPISIGSSYGDAQTHPATSFSSESAPEAAFSDPGDDDNGDGDDGNGNDDDFDFGDGYRRENEVAKQATKPMRFTKKQKVSSSQTSTGQESTSASKKSRHYDYFIEGEKNADDNRVFHCRHCE
jgi:hypothetical protein